MKDHQRVLHALTLLVAFNEGMQPFIAPREDGKEPDYEAVKMWAIRTVLDYIRETQQASGY